jgi:DNA-binding NarL/FixJ family response regulator
MKSSTGKKATTLVAVVDSDPLRFVGFRASLSAESDLDIQSLSLDEIGSRQDVDIVLLGNYPRGNALEQLCAMKRVRPGLSVIVTGCNMDDTQVLKIIAAGAKGCVDEAAPAGELAKAIRIVKSGSVWAPRRVLAMFVEEAYRSTGRGISPGHRPFTSREKEVLSMLVAGCSNKEIAAPLGIEERTVKAHVAKLMRKAGVANRILLSIHAVTHSLVRPTS